MIPTYHDGRFDLFVITEGDDTYPVDILKDCSLQICFREVSIGDKLKYELSQSNIEVTTKIVIPQYKGITSDHVVKIEGVYHKVYNTYHYTDKDGNRETTLTLERYKQ